MQEQKTPRPANRPNFPYWCGRSGQRHSLFVTSCAQIAFWTVAYLHPSKEAKTMAKVIAVLYPDPVDGYPKKYARDDPPSLEGWL
jgi:hypothetical protein